MNRIYYHLIKDRDQEQREAFDAELYGLNDANEILSQIIGHPNL